MMWNNAHRRRVGGILCCNIVYVVNSQTVVRVWNIVGLPVKIQSTFAQLSDYRILTQFLLMSSIPTFNMAAFLKPSSMVQ